MAATGTCHHGATCCGDSPNQGTRPGLLNTNTHDITHPHAPASPGQAGQEDSDLSVELFLVLNSRWGWKKLHYLLTGISLRPVITIFPISNASTLLISPHSGINGPSETLSLQVPIPTPEGWRVWHFSYNCSTSRMQHWLKNETILHSYTANFKWWYIILLGNSSKTTLNGFWNYLRTRTSVKLND